ncbi:type IV pilus modification PilV family protein [Geomonas edaphica]|uniref:type IV pilus modification PilV family protein n=1 Tax=Geomonas edaphica TaxID=2570226 RepID=UPI0010A8CC73|nr:prepilin-type N-terminal cleavage/methylation domain-containing protein [Geomonas edaphica]
MTASRQTSLSSNGGFTLVEMLMAMLVMTVGLLGLLQAVIVAYQHGMKNRFRAEAVLVAEKQMHGWTRLPFEKIKEKSGETKEETTKVGGVPWSYKVTTKAEPAGSTTTTLKLTVGVIWSPKGETASHEIYALRTRRVGE